VKFRTPPAVFLPATLLVLLGLQAAGCGRAALPPGLPPNIAEITGVTEREGLAPAFTWRGTDGREVRFDDERGGVTLVNFWATWCGPCKKELPDLVELSRRYADRGFRVIGVATDRTPNAASLVAEFVGKYSIPYQVVLSTQEVERAFGNVRQMPTSFLVDRDGRIVRTIIGISSQSDFEKAIAPLL
jgi:thiol-disulfide isomerase/thioredoxin